MNIPTKEFIEENFVKIFNELTALKKQIKPSKIEQKFYRNKDLKKIFGLSDNTIYYYRENGKIPFTKMGEIFFYPDDQLDKVLKENSNY